ncbi:hypothetical protein ACXYRK_01580 [Mycoplasma sp. AC1221]
MKLNQLQEIKGRQLNKIKPGFAFLSLLTGIPLLASSLASIVGLFRTAFSANGEIKNKTTTYKWSHNEKSSTTNSKTNYIIF